MRFYSASADSVASSSASLRRARIRRVLTISAFSIFFTSAGFFIATVPAIASIVALMSAPTDARSVAMYHAPDEIAAQINDFVNNHPLSRSLRAHPAWIESRPYLRYPESHRKHSLTAGTLQGPGKIPVPPLVFVDEGKSLVSLSYLGTELCGHAGIVHGGLLATLLDEGLARCGFGALPNGIAVTASLAINFRKPAPAGSFVVLKAETIRCEGRKVWVKGRIETLGDGEEPGETLVDAEGLFVEPKYAKVRPAKWKAPSLERYFVDLKDSLCLISSKFSQNDRACIRVT